MAADLLVFNGLDGTTGDYLIPPMAPDTLARIARGRPEVPLSRELKLRHENATKPDFRPMAGIDAKDLAQSGWGIIFPAKAEGTVVAAILEALAELIDLRKRQAGELYREFTGPRGYRPGESKDDFLKRYGTGPGPVDPKLVPYYLLLVGDPESIPYRFQYELDVGYAVGRIHFDMLDKYAQYARSVAQAESPGKVKLPRRAVFFATGNRGDGSTALSSEHLVLPLTRKMTEDRPDWQVQVVQKEEALKARLCQLVGGPDTPAVLFTASHGLGFPYGDKRQLTENGALVCQDWPGPGRGVTRDHYLTAEDIGDDARLLGLIAFHFACFGAGTPFWDDFTEQAFRTRSAIAPHPFIAALPQRLLSHPRGGALAAVGHVERVWTYSFKWTDKDEGQTTTFQSMLRQLFDGYPIGAALDDFNTRYAEIATMLSAEVEESKWGDPDVYKLAYLWTANNDARGYAIVGDPAVRLPELAADAGPEGRPALDAVERRAGAVPAILVPDPSFAGVPAPELGDRARAGGEITIPGGSFQTDGSPYTAGQVQEAMVQLLGDLTVQMARLVDAMTSLAVATYVGDAPEAMHYDRQANDFGPGAQLRALTMVALDGGTQTCVPGQGSSIDPALWEIHSSTVRLAHANRAAMLETVTKLLAGLTMSDRRD